MNKKQKIEYINKVNDRFINARNHGHNGGNWWYPKADTIAYNVKMYHAGVSQEDILKEMTARQKEYYKSGEVFEQLYQDEIEMAGESLVDEVEQKKLVKNSGFAGRSGGWYEVEYNNCIGDYDLDDTKQLNDAYNTAKELDKTEQEVAELVESRKNALEKYLSSKEFIRDIVKDILLDDESIANVYKGKAKDLLDKLK